MKKNRSIISVIIATIATIGLAFTAPAQSTNIISTNEFPVISSVPSVQSFISSIWIDPSVDYYSDVTNEIQGGVGLSQKTQQSGTYQATRVAYYHQIQPALSGGANAEIDSLGVNGQGLNQIEFGGQVRYGYHNVAGGFQLDGIRDFQNNAWGIEPTLLIEDSPSPNFSLNLLFGPDIEFGHSGNTSIRTALFATLRI